jgi:hypothetical protein
MSNLYSEANKGFYTVPPAQGVYEENASQKAELGYRLAFSDGRVFRYAKAGASNLAAGKAVKAGLISEDREINKAVTTATLAGAYTVTLTTSSAVTTGADGYLQINDDTGEGSLMKIKLTAANASTATRTDVTLYDPIPLALTTSSEGTIIHNPYEQCEIATNNTQIVLGVPPIAVTAEYYFWLQTWGIASVLVTGTPAAGVRVTVSEVVNGAASAMATATIQAFGIMGLVGVDTEYKPVFLTICP